MAYSPSGNVLASASYDRTIRLWNSETGELLRIPRGHTSMVRALAFTADGKRLVSGGGHSPSEVGELKVWNASNGKLLLSFPGHLQGVRGVAVSPDGKWIVSAGTEARLSTEVKVLDANTGELLFPLVGHTHVVTRVLFSPDGRRIITASFDGTVKLWDSRSP